MIDPLLGLSFNLHSQKGGYALLIGSGVSRNASIPTGWEVTLDLISKLAALCEETCEGSEVDWYLAKYEKEPVYSEVLSEIAPTSAAHQRLLKNYFEPNEQEREDGDKLPTAAHNSIAKLVSLDYVKVIVTTNFDRLIETALETEGVTPVVIATPDAAKGAPPIAHSKCTVIKVHGDYLDNRIKNSLDALSEFESSINLILDQVFNEYGLIVSGWSADYDKGLRNALQRSKARRYPMYWTGLSNPTGPARNVIALHGAQFIEISGADSFFADLLEKVETLREFDRPHPISTQAAVATLKRYLSEDKYSIQLRDFLMAEVDQVRDLIDRANSNLPDIRPTHEIILEHMKRLEAACEKLIHLFATGSFLARPAQAKVFFEAFHLIVLKARSGPSNNTWLNRKKYPALLLAYAAGLSAVANENYGVLAAIANKPSYIKHDEDKEEPAPAQIYTHGVMDDKYAQQRLPGTEKRHTPHSDYLYEVMREPLRPWLPDDTQYERAFDNFEYLWCIAHVDAESQGGGWYIRAPFGAFIWRRRHNADNWYQPQAKLAADASDDTWPPLKGGMFGGSSNRLAVALEKAQPFLDEIRESF